MSQFSRAKMNDEGKEKLARMKKTLVWHMCSELLPMPAPVDPLVFSKGDDEGIRAVKRDEHRKKVKAREQEVSEQEPSLIKKMDDLISRVKARYINNNMACASCV